MSTDVMIVEEAEYEEAEEERSVAVDSTSTAVGSADSEDENNSGEENSVQCGCCGARQTCGQAGKMLQWPILLQRQLATERIVSRYSP